MQTLMTRVMVVCAILVALVVALAPVMALAQVAGDAGAVVAPAVPAAKMPIGQMVLGGLATLLPTLLAVYGPQATHGLQNIYGKIPASVSPFVSVLMGALLSVVTAAVIPGAPPLDVSALTGGAIGLAVHPVKQADAIVHGTDATVAAVPAKAA